MKYSKAISFSSLFSPQFRVKFVRKYSHDGSPLSQVHKEESLLTRAKEILYDKSTDLGNVHNLKFSI